MSLTVVLLMDDLEEWSGTEVHLRRLVGRLDPAQITPVLAVLGRDGLAGEFTAATGAAVHGLNIQSTLSLEGARGAAAVARLLKQLSAGLLVTYHTAADLLGPVAGALAGVPVLSCRRDEGFTKKPVHVALQRPLNRLLTGMIVVSHKVRQAVRASEGYPSARCQVIWNGEDLDRFAPGPSGLRRELGIGPDVPLVASVSLLTPIKDHDTQLRAMELLAERMPDATLLIVGDGPERERLEALAAPLGQRVRFLGHRDDIPELLRGVDVLLQTSTSEGFSNTILQAMATALPVVVTAVGGNVELVSTKCGHLVDRRSPEEVARYLAQLLGSARARARMGTAGRARVEQYCSLPAMVERYTDAFQRGASHRFPGPSYP
mgnify:CR=1 FL=1